MITFVSALVFSVYYFFCVVVRNIDRDFQRIDNALLAPVTKALAPIANISVESQVAFTTEPKSLASVLFSRATVLYLFLSLGFVSHTKVLFFILG